MVDTDFYKDVPTSPELEGDMKNIHLILDAFGTPVDTVGRKVAEIAGQSPGKVSGKCYSLLKGLRLARGIGLMLWYRISGRLK